MRLIRIAMLVLFVAMALGRAVAMLPPETFRDPIFASNENSGDEDGGDSGYTKFA